MQSSSILEKLKSIDPVNNREQFYSYLWINLPYLNAKDKQFIIEWSSNVKSYSELQEAYHHFTEGMDALYSADFLKVLSILLQATEVFKKLDHKPGLTISGTMLCTCYRSLGQLDKAQDNIQKALFYAATVGSDKIYDYVKGVTYYQAAEINVELKNYDTAIEYYNKGIQFTTDYPEFKARYLTGVGILAMHLGNQDEAISNLNEALEVISDQDNFLIESKILADIGIYYFRMKDFEKSRAALEKSLEIRLEKGLRSPAITNYIKLAELCLADGRIDEAIRYGNTAVEQSEKLKVNIKLYEAHQALALIYDEAGDIEKAYYHYKISHKLKEEVHSQEVIKKVEQIKNQFKVESAQQEKEIFRLRNVELKAAMEEITESFRYAKRIQTAILPPDDLIKEKLSDSFVLFKPKDIVSGDFYWLEIVGDKILIAAVDCTGHGVPGAMVSMVGYNCLNRTVREFGLTEPAAILNKLTELVEDTFRHKDFHQINEDEIKDGMDISLCCIDLFKEELEWAGANNPLWMVRNNELIETAADKQPVGKFEFRHAFTNYKTKLKKGDAFYLFTDGYADQFGGPHGKKFKYKQLKELLLSFKGKAMKDQLQELSEEFESWKGNLEQIDDVLMIGFRIG